MARTDDPAYDWDVYCAEQDAEYERLVMGRTCADCEKCFPPPDGEGNYGWCIADNDWVELDELVTDIGCEVFE